MNGGGVSHALIGEIGARLGLLAKGPLAVSASPDHFLRGLLIERTPYQHLYYVWSYLLPIFGVSGVKSLNYSRRMKNPSDGRETFAFNGEEGVESACAVLENAIHVNSVDFAGEYTIQRFLSEFTAEWAAVRPALALDHAIACCQAGNIEFGRDAIFEISRLTAGNSREHAIILVAGEMLAKLAEGRDAFVLSIRARESQFLEAEFPEVCFDRPIGKETQRSRDMS